MDERNGVRVGRRVRDLDGNPLGRVTALYEWGFAVRRGFPILFRHDVVARYDEVRGTDGDTLILARSPRDLFELAAGEVPRSWRIPVPPEFPSAATPIEARGVYADLARGAIPVEGVAPPPPPATRSPLTAEEEREYAHSRGESAAAPLR